MIRFGDGQFTEIQRELIGGYIATLATLPGINETLKKHILTQLIILLPRAEAVFNDYQTKKKSRPCFEGTRVALLREMADWVTSLDESRMYILSGLAGIGKSTVAYTIASRAADLTLLGASFFFSRDEADRNNAKKLFTTIAYQLCVYDEGFAKAIGDALQTERGSAATTKSPQEQLHALILDPLRSLVQSRERPILVVVDALDECDECDIYAVAMGLSQLVQDLKPFKVILTTRPLPYLDRFLRNQGSHRLFHLQDIEDKIIDSDIRLYLRYSLSLENVLEHFPRRQWCASDEEINTLVRATGRLFIIASTSVRYILDKSASNPAAQMKKLLHAYTLDHTPFKDLNQFYTVILRNVIPENCEDNDIVSRYQSVIGTIIFVQHPLSVSTLAHLIDIDEEEIHAVLDHLQSVILLGDDNVPHIYHKSFPDYLTNKARCKDSNLCVDPKVHHTQIATCCFEIAEKHLKYNILGFDTPARFMNNEDGRKKDGITDEQVEAKIPQQLRYACVYWAAHFEVADIEDSDIINGLNKFVNGHLLHWFEVLSLIGKLDSAHLAIRAALKLLKSTSSDLHQLLSDALRFISKFYNLITDSALHIYYSALPFSPTESRLYHQYIQEAKDGICYVEGGPKKWDALITKLNDRQHTIDVVKFSLDSTLLASYSNTSRWLKLLDAATGIPITIISGSIFAISNTLATIASSEDNVITCYNTDGSPTGTIVTTSSWIEDFALSSESNRIAAALSDGTVCLRDSMNGELIDSFDGYKGTKYQRNLQFSRYGTRLVYSSANGIVKLRDGISGRFVADLQCGSRRYRDIIEFSGNGHRIASLSHDSGLRLWNSESGGLIAAANVVWDKSHMDLAISVNGSLLAAADINGVTLWSEQCGQLTKIEVLVMTGPIAFSPDNLLAIRVYSRVDIYNPEIHTIIASTPLPIAPPLVPVAFSPDGTRLACGSLLDVQAINASGSLSRTFNETLTGIALSRDCSRLACAFKDGTIELWGTIPTMRCIASHQAYSYRPCTNGFGPDGRLFATWSLCESIKLWNGRDESWCGTLISPHILSTVALSNSKLVAGGGGKVTLWDLDTLSIFHTFEIFGDYAVISDQGDLVAIHSPDEGYCVFHLFDLKNRTTSNIKLRLFAGSLIFLPDKSHLMIWPYNDNPVSLDLVKKCVTSGPVLEHLIQLPDFPLWHGVPVWLCQAHMLSRQRRIVALFSQDTSPVPVLWIPTDILVEKWAQGSSMIALACEDGRDVLLQLRTGHVC